jgi:DNA-binding NarL/FixJ family response regulator
MPATITAEERALIDAKVAAGKVTRCATGASAAEIEYIWCSKINRLVPKDKERATALYRGSMQRHFNRKKAGPTPEQIQRRETVIGLMDQGMTREQIATTLGVSTHTVSADAKAMGRTFPRPARLPSVCARVDARRAKVSKLVGKGMTAPEIAAQCGVNSRTIWDDVKALGIKMPKAAPAYKNPKQRRPGPAPCPKVAARRAKIPALIEQGMGGRQMSIVLGVPLDVVQHDCRVMGISIPRNRRLPAMCVATSMEACKDTAARLVKEMRKAGNSNDEIRKTLLAIVEAAA